MGSSACHQAWRPKWRSAWHLEAEKAVQVILEAARSRVTRDRVSDFEMGLRGCKRQWRTVQMAHMEGHLTQT